MTWAERLGELIERERQRFSVPGCAVTVVRDGQVVLSSGFGLRDVDQQLPVTSQTLMPIGSATKTFTAALCASLVEAGDLDWDTPLREYLPGFRMHDPVATELLSIRDCLAHRSGLPRHDLLWYAARLTLTRDDLIDALRHLPASKPFRQTWQYNNLLYTAAGHVAGRLAGSTFETAVQTRLLDPLRMTRTNLTVSQTQADPDHARPYVRQAGTGQTTEVPFADLTLAGPAGSINSSADELARWLLTLLGQEIDGQPPLLRASVLDELRTPAIPLPAVVSPYGAAPVGYGLGLVLEDYRGIRLAHHGGNIDGFSSMLLHSPEAGIGMAVLTNLSATPLRDVIPYVLLDELLGLDPRAHGEAGRARWDAVQQGAAQAAEQRSARSKPLPAVRPLSDYAGRYSHPGYGTATVAASGDALTLAYSDLAPAALQHRHLEVFEATVEVGGNEQRMPVQFTHDLEADVDGLLIRLEPELPPQRFARQPDAAGLSEQLLNAAAGSYTLGPLTAVVSRRGEHELVVSVMGSAPAPLAFVHGRVFSYAGKPVEFTLDGRLLTEMGEFHRAETAGAGR